jgi:DNA-3-methyladenine glycosylase II
MKAIRPSVTRKIAFHVDGSMGTRSMGKKEPNAARRRPRPSQQDIPLVRHPTALRLALPGPTDFGLCVRRYADFGPDEANRLDGAGALRFVRVIDRERFLATVCAAGTTVSPVLRVEILGTAPASRGARARLREQLRWRFGAHFDLESFYAWAARDAVLAPLAAAFRGYRPPLTLDAFESLVTSISAQQVNLAFAFATRSRLVRAFGPALCTPDGEVYQAFPSPEDLSFARSSRLRAMKFSGTKTRAILELARGLCREPMPLDAVREWDAARIREMLVRFHGIGRWTADWFLARALGRPDAWPAGDLGLRKAVAHFYFAGRDLPEDEVRAFGERFGLHRNLAAHYLLMGYMAERRRATASRR